MPAQLLFMVCGVVGTCFTIWFQYRVQRSNRDDHGNTTRALHSLRDTVNEGRVDVLEVKDDVREVKADVREHGIRIDRLEHS